MSIEVKKMIISIIKGFGITHFFSFFSQYMRWNLFINQVIFGGHVQ
jgi:hypothetical protein